jgi:hypothetical protein
MRMAISNIQTMREEAHENPMIFVGTGLEYCPERPLMIPQKSAPNLQ